MNNLPQISTHPSGLRQARDLRKSPDNPKAKHTLLLNDLFSYQVSNKQSYHLRVAEPPASCLPWCILSLFLSLLQERRNVSHLILNVVSQLVKPETRRIEKLFMTL